MLQATSLINKIVPPTLIALIILNSNCQPNQSTGPIPADINKVSDVFIQLPGRDTTYKLLEDDSKFKVKWLKSSRSDVYRYIVSLDKDIYPENGRRISIETMDDSLLVKRSDISAVTESDEEYFLYIALRTRSGIINSRSKNVRKIKIKLNESL